MLTQHSNTIRNKPKLAESSRQLFERNREAIFRTLKSQNVSHAGMLSVCSLAGSEQLAGMKEVADWRCLKLDAKTLPNSQQQKRTKTQNV